MARAFDTFTIYGRTFQLRATGWNEAVGAYGFGLWEIDNEGNAHYRPDCLTFGYLGGLGRLELKDRARARVEMWIRNGVLPPLES